MNIWITDKTGAKFWNTNVSDEWSIGEQRNFAKRLAAIKLDTKGFEFIDSATARIETDLPAMSDDEILAELTA